MCNLIKRWKCSRKEARRERRKKQRWEKFFKNGGAAQYFKAGGAIR